MFRMKAFGRLLGTAGNARNTAPSTLIAMSTTFHPRSSGTFPLPAMQRSFVISSSRYFTRTVTLDAELAELRPLEEPEKWIAILENTAAAPWLLTLPPDHENRLKLAYTLLFQIVLYLSRPMEAEQAEQFLVAFGTAVVPPESEIGRARSAVIPILNAVVHHISSIPINSSVRAENPEIFDIFSALQAIHDMYLMDSINALENWSEVWPRIQPVVLELGMKLDEKGFGLNLDELDDTTKTEEKPE
ncbi:hypothetical protein Hypma_004420 [Hypsizygus marmoreus]|uniref:Uncharacterized protein n=1 Tax=Hypsizygus marmoreus TaxID=39966 RepID=A0A369K164_HYPMA|nr:hypothetical protein Hypma_004420 [Hypsizygus marmoreus]